MIKLLDTKLDKPFSLIGTGILKDLYSEGIIERAYICTECNTNFRVTHHKVYVAPYTWGWNDYQVTCPACGHKHIYSSKTNNSTVVLGEEQSAPLRIRLIVLELRDSIKLTVKYSGYKFRWVDGHTRTESRKTKWQEDFIYDVRTRTTTYRKSVGGELTYTSEFGQPFEHTVLDNTALRFIRSSTLLHDTKSRSTVTRLLKVIRDAVSRKFKAIHRRDLRRLYVSSGAGQSYFLTPLQNIAYRLACPEMPNIKYTAQDIYYIKTSKYTQEFYRVNAEMVEQANNLEQFRSGAGVKYLLASVGAPTTRAIINLVYLYGFIAIPVLKRLSEASTATDDVLRMWKLLNKHNVIHHDHNRYNDRFLAITDFLVNVSKVKPLGTVIAFADEYCTAHPDGVQLLRDITSLLNVIPRDKKAPLAHVKMSRLHDTLVEIHNRQIVEGFSLQVPQATLQLLTFDNSQTAFHVPEHSKELDAASVYFHNCVRTYGERMMQGLTCIVIMTDGLNEHKPVACLEIQRNWLVQAKLKYNKAVCENPDINNRIIQWCDHAGLQIKTEDVIL